MKQVIGTLLSIAFACSVHASAAEINLFQGSGNGTVGSGSRETRQTYIEILSPLYLFELGADIDPNTDRTYTWRVREASETDAFDGNVLFEEDYEVIDDGFKTYDFSVGLALGPGFYLIEMDLFSVNGFGTTMRRIDEGGQSLPYEATEAIKVLDGGANGSLNNGILPAFSVTVEDLVETPLPGALPLFAGALVLVGWGRRQRSAS